MNTAGSIRSREWADLLRDAGIVFGKITLLVLTVFLLLAFFLHFYFTSSAHSYNFKPKIKEEILIQQYSELLATTENLYGFKESIKTYKNRLTVIAVSNRDRPELLWSKREIAERDRLKERYETLVADYGTMVLEYNSRHRAIDYCFIYPNNLPYGVVKTLPKYYVPLE